MDELLGGAEEDGSSWVIKYCLIMSYIERFVGHGSWGY